MTHLKRPMDPGRREPAPSPLIVQNDAKPLREGPFARCWKRDGATVVGEGAPARWRLRAFHRNG
jgi:hypothetical protein